MRNLLFWGLFPFALPQAVYVRRTAPRFAPPDCAPSGRVGSGPPLKIVGIGDSIIAGVGAAPPGCSGRWTPAGSGVASTG